MVGAVVDRVAVIEQAAYGAAELAAVGVKEGDVVEAGVAAGRRRAAGALPGVEADVVVVVAGGQEGGVESGLASVGCDTETECVAIERERAVEVGDSQVDVADADGRVKGFGVHRGGVLRFLRRRSSVCSPNRAAGAARESPIVDPISPPALVGRARECEAIAAALEALRVRPGGTLAVEGEPGIGKSLLLAQLAARAEAGGCTVLWGRASEFEADLPYALWTDALEAHLAESGERRRSRLGVPDPGALGVVVPTLADTDGEPAPGDRHRTHRALRDLLERLAAVRPLVLCMDDVHWADPASIDALAALVRRPPTTAVLLAVALREGQAPAALAAALAYAMREDRVTRLAPAPLDEAEAAELVGPAAAAIYPLSGGNPFYLEQLARVPRGAHAGADIAADASVPPAVADALSTELTGLTPRRAQDARRGRGRGRSIRAGTGRRGG